MSRFTILAFLALATAGAVAVIDARSSAPIRTSPSAAGPAGIYATGVVEGAAPDVELRSETMGRVHEVHVATGDVVQPGAVLLTLDDRRERQAVAAAAAKRELARAQLERLVNGARPAERAEAEALLAAKRAQREQAFRTWQRVRDLHQQAAVSQQEADDKRSLVDALNAEVQAAEARVEQLTSPAREDEVRAAEARIAAAEADLELAQLALEKCTLRAPGGGCVLDVQVEPGELIGPAEPRPAVVLADTSVIRVRAYVEEVDAPRLEVGMQARITADGLPGKFYTGRIFSLSPRMAPKQVFSGRPDELYDTKMREVIMQLDDSPGLIVGLRVDVMVLPMHGAARPGQLSGPAVSAAGTTSQGSAP